MDKLIFLFAAFFLVWGLRLQSSPESAARGNKYAALGMFLAIFGSIIMPDKNPGFNNYLWIFLPLTASSNHSFSACVSCVAKLYASWIMKNE